MAAPAFQQPLYTPKWLRGTATFGALIWFILHDFLMSFWVYANLFVLLLAQVWLSGDTPSRERFFNVAYLTTMLLAAINTAGILSRANHPHTYPILARPVSRTTYVTACMVAAWLVSIAGYVITILLTIFRYGPPLHAGAASWLNLTTLQMGSVPVVVACTFAVSLLALLSNFVSPFWVRLAALGIIGLLVMAFDPRTFPIDQLRPLVEKIPPLLAPIAGALRYATDPQPDPIATASILIVAAYTTTLLALVLWLSTRREIVLE